MSNKLKSINPKQQATNNALLRKAFAKHGVLKWNSIPPKRNEVLIHATTWMNLENIMLRE